MHDGRIDAEPMKDVNKFEVLKAFKKIYSRDIFILSYIITFDKGNEFKNPEVEKYFNQNGTLTLTLTLTGRSRQLANVERANQKISSILFKRMANQELITGEQNNDLIFYFLCLLISFLQVILLYYILLPVLQFQIQKILIQYILLF